MTDYDATPSSTLGFATDDLAHRAGAARAVPAEVAPGPPGGTWWGAVTSPPPWQWRRPARQGYGLGAIVLLGFGCAAAGGLYQPLGLVAIVLGACLAVLAPTGENRSASSLAWLAAVFIGALSNRLALGISGLESVVPVLAGIAACTILVVRRRWVRQAAVVATALLGLVPMFGNLVWGRAAIDVFNSAQLLTARLLAGGDPYSVLFRTTTPHLRYGHYFYGPAVLLLSIPGRLVGDIRVSNLLSTVVLVVCITLLARRHGGSEHGWRCLALCLTLPFFPFMILQAWAEIYLLTAIALWLLLRDRHRWAAVAALGVGMATVPTALPLIVLPFLWWRRPRVEIVIAAVIGVAICAPFAIWVGPSHFLSDTIGLQLRLPPRVDGLDLDAAWLRLTDTWLPFWLWPAVAGVTLALLSRARPRSWAAALYLGSNILVVAFLYAKWAFFNYYLLVAVGIIIAIALDGIAELAGRDPAADPVPAQSLGPPVAVPRAAAS
jgi:hypothetical protein